MMGLFLVSRSFQLSRGLDWDMRHFLSSLSEAPSVGQRRHSDQLSESHAKMALVTESNGLTDFGNRLVCQSEQ